MKLKHFRSAVLISLAVLAPLVLGVAIVMKSNSFGLSFRRPQIILKRLLDITASIIGLALLWPLFLLIAVAVKLNSTGPILYRAERIGQHGKLFRLYKFRSMVTNADKLGPAVTGASDSRITAVGRILRQTKLDELPQMYNVLRGDMSLVGPRPEAPRYVGMYTPEQRKILDVRPGITSLASIAYRHESDMLVGEAWEQDYITKVMPAKISIDLEYVKNPTVFTDIRILTQTVGALFT